MTKLTAPQIRVLEGLLESPTSYWYLNQSTVAALRRREYIENAQEFYGGEIKITEKGKQALAASPVDVVHIGNILRLTKEHATLLQRLEGKNSSVFGRHRGRDGLAAIHILKKIKRECYFLNLWYEMQECSELPSLRSNQ